jgi:hypothetical protein
MYRVWPFQNVVRFTRNPNAAGNPLKFSDETLTIGVFQGMRDDGNIIIGEGSFCNKINAPRSGTVVVKCGPRSLTMVETSSCVYAFTMFHPRLCSPEPTYEPTEEPTTAPFYEPTAEPTAEPTSPSPNPLAVPTRYFPYYFNFLKL